MTKILRITFLLGLFFFIGITLVCATKSENSNGFSKEIYPSDVKADNDFSEPEKIVFDYVKMSQTGKLKEIEKLTIPKRRDVIRNANNNPANNSIQDSKYLKSEVPYSLSLNESDYKFLSIENPKYIEKHKLKIEKFSTNFTDKNNLKVIVDFVNENGLYIATQTYFLKENEIGKWKIIRIIFGEDENNYFPQK